VLLTARGQYDGAEELRGLLRRLRTADDPGALISAVRHLLWTNGSMRASLDVAWEAFDRARKIASGLHEPARRTLDEYANATVRPGLRPSGKATAA
jgi:hypothetical protein